LEYHNYVCVYFSVALLHSLITPASQFSTTRSSSLKEHNGTKIRGQRHRFSFRHSVNPECDQLRWVASIPYVILQDLDAQVRPSEMQAHSRPGRLRGNASRIVRIIVMCVLFLSFGLLTLTRECRHRTAIHFCDKKSRGEARAWGIPREEEAEGWG